MSFQVPLPFRKTPHGRCADSALILNSCVIYRSRFSTAVSGSSGSDRISTSASPTSTQSVSPSLAEPCLDQPAEDTAAY